ncbi:MAG: hypothetical protein HFJ27_05780 [Clostridia bacterium]|nr:hypothetical protein [Clostridia bacterium]
MKKEIGGYFELEKNYGSLYHNSAIPINTARNCLEYLIKSRKIKKIYVPYYLCDAINKVEKYCEIEYYKISKEFLPSFEKELQDNEYIYIVNYFGLFTNSKVIKLRKKYKNIILDNVQAFFQKPVHNVDTIYSCRKFFGVPDGAFLYTKQLINEEIKEDFSNDRFRHILGRVEEGAEEHYREYRKNEEKINSLPLKRMSITTETILRGINYKKIKNIRTKNFKYLNYELKRINELQFRNIRGAFIYPLYVKNALELREDLIKNKIYIPILWPNVIKTNKDNIAYEYATKILPIPCDQRYSIEEMKKIVRMIKENC